ncbi:MAG: glycogen debranching enzyme N-terminal domain-containing protein [Armatimonadetes bacterium]|nr:glycogen debranching enzyme N-terminal domain-containing protein [Armatimonadota bacterium]
MTYRIARGECRDLDRGRHLEWLLANGMGGFAMGTVSGINTRRYHGLLVAATRPPAERILALAGLEAGIQRDNETVWISANEYPGVIHPEGYRHIESFEVDGEAVWQYAVGRDRLERATRIGQGVNQVAVSFRNRGKTTIRLVLRPLVAVRDYHGNSTFSGSFPDQTQFLDDATAIEHAGTVVLLGHCGADRTAVQGWYYRFHHAREADRGLDPSDDLFCPCELAYVLKPGDEAQIVTSASLAESEGSPASGLLAAQRDPAKDRGGLETIEDEAAQASRLSALGSTTGDSERRVSLSQDSPAGSDPVAESLIQAASKFLVAASGRTSIIAGYPWFTDWGRDTMIALPGVCLCTGRIETAREILRSYARHVKDGLIPNRFPEEGGADYNTADATLWFGYAIQQTLDAEWDEPFAVEMLALLEGIVDHHLEGTHFGIMADPEDGLLTQGVPGLQLTWMDAKIGSWVVTPRHGKAVEINGLWINFLRSAEWIAGRLGQNASGYRMLAEKAEASFDAAFWDPAVGWYRDIAHPQDSALRPNQVIAMGLLFGPATGDHATLALDAVEKHLLTPYGLRTLGPDEPGYRGRFEGPLSELDSAYHQGTVWPWLLGPYVDAVLRVTGDWERARKALARAPEMLSERGLGGIAEVYDGDSPHRPNGCPWQAWSVSEILRAWLKTAH